MTVNLPFLRRQPRAVAVVLFSLISVVSGCQQYGRVSPACCQTAMALYSACNRHDNDRLATIRKLVTTSEESSEMSNREADWLLQIVTTAESGDWEIAMQDARTMLDEQVTR